MSPDIKRFSQKKIKSILSQGQEKPEAFRHMPLNKNKKRAFLLPKNQPTKKASAAGILPISLTNLIRKIRPVFKYRQRAFGTKMEIKTKIHDLLRSLIRNSAYFEIR
ncbi:MAG TPA: hypothetical protein DD376_05445 [Sutterella sp.]|nr:hypothetical protein [Sutterella sp.]